MRARAALHDTCIQLRCIPSSHQRKHKQPPDRPVGLRNLGNTCYVSASLQMLRHVGAFRDALLRLEEGIVAGQDVVAQMRCARADWTGGRGLWGRGLERSRRSFHAESCMHMPPSASCYAAHATPPHAHLTVHSTLLQNAKPVRITLQTTPKQNTKRRHDNSDLFLALEYGARACADPTDFARALQLDHTYQQDGSEFLKLLLQKLEHVFEGSGQEVRAR